MYVVILLSTCVSVIAVLLICLFLLINGVPAIAQIGPFRFFAGTTWRPSSEMFGILPMILGSLYVTAGAIVVGVPIGVLTAIYMARFCPHRLYRILRPAVSLLAGIPSVVYGFFGLMVLVPLTRNLLGGNGSSILTASLLLGIMILPTIISVSEASLRAVPQSYYEGSLAMGATHEESVFRAVVPAAKSGILSSVVLGIGRAVGETMAVVMVAGNQARLPAGLLRGVRSLTANIVLEMGYAADLHREALIATGVVLFVFILLTNLLFSLLKRGRRE
ncbi:MAG: phosphate ABC transporter permease subunit PstC [Oscillospiraceae bacterium]